MANDDIFIETIEEFSGKRVVRTKVPADKDYTQVYTCFSQMSTRIRQGVSYQLLFWLLANRVNKSRGFGIDTYTYEDFNKFMVSHCSDCGVSRATFDRSVKELVNSGAITRIGKGSYYANAYGFWKGSSKERRLFLAEEAKHNRYKMLNPSPPVITDVTPSGY